MPYLMPGDLHVNRDLTQVMVAYQQSAENFVADKIFPNIPVDKPTDFYYKMGRKSFLQTQMQKRAPRTETPGVDWNFTRDTFATETWGLHHDVEDQERSSADDNWNLDRTGTELITSQALLRREKEWFGTFFKTGVWSVDEAGVTATPGANQFLMFDQSGSSPISVFKAARRRFHKRTGVKPNFVVFGPDVWDVIIDHAEFIDRIKYTQNALALTQALVGQAIQIPNIYIAEAVEATDQTGDELTADPVPATQYLASNTYLLGYAAPRPNKNTPSAGYTFSWKGYLGASAFGGRIKKYRMEHIASDRIEIEMAYDYKIVAPELGEYYTNAVTAV